MTPSSTISISSDRVIQWMNAIRDARGVDQHRLLENFWASQLRSKAWLINTLRSLRLLDEGDVYIFGGWYGILGSLIKDNFLYKHVYSIDLDPICQTVGTRLDARITFVTGDMAHYSLVDRPNVGLIVNTSTEHVTQDVYDQWLAQMPANVPIVLQGNDFYSCEEHVRCTTDLDEFISINSLANTIFTGKLNCQEFTRFMIVGYKNVNN